MRPFGVDGGSDGKGAERDSELRHLFHRLNNQLGIILAHAELLEAKASDGQNRARASQVVTSALEAMGTIRDIRSHVRPAAEGP